MLPRALGTPETAVALLAVPFGLAIGLSLGVLGGGGAVLALPVLVYVLGQDVHAATTVSLAAVAAAALAGGAMQASAPGCAGLRWPCSHRPHWSGRCSGRAGQAVSDAVLLLGFVPVLVVAAVSTWRRSGDVGNGGACPRLDPERALAGGAVGLLTGFFGVGGGFLVVPVLVLALHFPLRRAIGTSLVIVGLVSVAGFVVHLGNGPSSRSISRWRWRWRVQPERWLAHGWPSACPNARSGTRSRCC